ncbi:MAG: hypothetical protein A2Y95_11210 [Deltaproteobacteria bacterium RBG_13_65_10]|nr:MAG: hypothetical protein A2Y95_11210 [Deltaproteobacteria bacterium RBG_13_65_10]
MSIVEYTDRKAAIAEYPQKIISPRAPSTCCVEGNRERVGEVQDEDGETYFYKRCRVCGHTVKFFFTPRHKSTFFEIWVYLSRKKATLH